MKAKELKDKLQNIPDDKEIVILTYSYHEKKGLFQPYKKFIIDNSKLEISCNKFNCDDCVCKDNIFCHNKNEEVFFMYPTHENDEIMPLVKCVKESDNSHNQSF